MKSESAKLKYASVWAAAIAIAYIGYVLLIDMPRSASIQAARSQRDAAMVETENNLRSTNGQLFLGVGIAIGIFLTYRRIRAIERQTKAAEDGQITERFSKAIEHLGTAEPERMAIRLGGIYALQRIMRDSAVDAPTVRNILAAFLRDESSARNSGSESGDNNRYPSDADFHAALLVLLENSDGSAPVNLEGMVLRSANLRNRILDRVNLSNAVLEDADFTGSSLIGANLSRAVLKGSKFNRAMMTEVSLTDADLTRADISDTQMDGADLEHANLHRAFLINSQLRGATLASANLSDALLHGADLEKAEVSEAQAQRASFKATNLTKAVFERCNLREAVLVGAQLSYTSFKDADLFRASLNFEDIHLESVDFDGANLDETSIQDKHASIVKRVRSSNDFSSKIYKKLEGT